MAEWLDNFHKAMTKVQDVDTTLSILANAFSTTGNTVLAEDLYNMRDDLRKARKLAEDAVHGNIHAQSKAATDSVGSTLKALLQAVKDEKKAEA